jgi:endonuclease/exonuclease/phosphatase family metal-dependent hydrolase
MARSAWRVLSVLLLVLLCLSPGPQASAGPTQITVMTQNLYTGADTNPILMAATIPDLQNAIKVATQSVIDNNFPLRAAAIAAEAARAGGPLLIGLQEAEIVSQAGVTLNYADAVIAALKTQGLNYTYMIPGIGATVHTGLSLDSAAAGLPGFVTLTDQDVVLVRTGVPGFTVKSISAPTFANPGTAQSPLFGQISLQRGYVLVDATLDGAPLQFVSTHLDGGLTSAEPAEINEILTALGTTGQPQLVVGDFNATRSDLCAGLPCGPAELLAAGFTDTGAALGPTCCQSPDLSNTDSKLNRQYDYIFERGFSSINSAALIGDQPFENVRPLWPSDHAGVVATFTEVPEPAAASLLVSAIFLFGAARLRGTPSHQKANEHHTGTARPERRRKSSRLAPGPWRLGCNTVVASAMITSA